MAIGWGIYGAIWFVRHEIRLIRQAAMIVGRCLRKAPLAKPTSPPPKRSLRELIPERPLEVSNQLNDNNSVGKDHEFKALYARPRNWSDQTIVEAAIALKAKWFHQL